jgi:hypothetical protein
MIGFAHIGSRPTVEVAGSGDHWIVLTPGWDLRGPSLLVRQ